DVITGSGRLVVGFSNEQAIDTVPVSINIQGFRVMVHLRGRKRTCFRCGADDHLKRDCTTVKCVSCRQLCHENCNQSPSYANTVKSRKEYPNNRGQRAVTNTRSSQDPDGFQGGNAVHENNTTLVAAENIEIEEITNVHDLSDTSSETDEVFEKLAWRHDIMNFAMPYMIQVMREYISKVELNRMKTTMFQSWATRLATAALGPAWFAGWSALFAGWPVTFPGWPALFPGWRATFPGWPATFPGWPATFRGWLTAR
ncbi:unnamed protein product, partial [Didymodactylos carnosus]